MGVPPKRDDSLWGALFYQHYTDDINHPESAGVPLPLYNRLVNKYSCHCIHRILTRGGRCSLAIPFREKAMLDRGRFRDMMLLNRAMTIFCEI